MSKPLRRTAAIVATAALAVSLGGCTAGQWVETVPPAAGVQTTEGGIKLRNFVVLSDGEGTGMILGGITSRDEPAEIVGLGYSAELEDGTFGELMAVPFSASIAEGKTITLDGAETSFSSTDLQLGRLAEVAVVLDSGERVSLLVPVMSSEHPDFAEAWAAATA